MRRLVVYPYAALVFAGALAYLRPHVNIWEFVAVILGVIMGLLGGELLAIFYVEKPKAMSQILKKFESGLSDLSKAVEKTFGKMAIAAMSMMASVISLTVASVLLGNINPVRVVEMMKTGEPISVLAGALYFISLLQMSFTLAYILKDIFPMLTAMLGVAMSMLVFAVALYSFVAKGVVLATTILLLAIAEAVISVLISRLR